MSDSKSYEVKYRCSNCYAIMSVCYPFKTEAFSSIDCPNCGFRYTNKTGKSISIVDIGYFGEYKSENEAVAFR